MLDDKGALVDLQLDDNGIALVQSSIGGQRSKLDVIATILHICLNGSLKNHLVGKGNFSDSMANHYLSILLYRQFLQVRKDENNRSVYTTTERGRQLLNHYGAIQQLFSNAEPQKDVEKPTARGSRNEVAKPEKGIRILIVDDEQDLTSAMKVGLSGEEFLVDVANDPQEVLKNYSPNSYDLLILDIRMPKMDGFQLFKEIRKIDRKVKVCYLTAYEVYYEEFKKAFPDVDINHFIRKPISMSDLMLQIRRLTES